MKVAIIPAAGKGTRFFELGRNYAKTLLPYDGIPILERIITRLNHDFDEIRVVAGVEFLQIKEFIDTLACPKVTLIVVPSEGPQGPGRSFMEAVTGEEDYVFLHLSDTLFDLEFESFLGDWVSVMDVKEPQRWCMISPSGELKDKPTTCGPEFKAMTGAYSFSDPLQLRKACEAAFVNAGPDEFQLSHIFEIYNESYRFDLCDHSEKGLLDFGTIEDYFKNNLSNGSRFFNKLEFSANSVRKSSVLFANELIAEALWTKYAPRSLQPFLPKVFEIDTLNTAYEMERIKSIKLRDLFIHLDRDVKTWRPIVHEIKKFLEVCQEVEIEASFWKKICDKTLLRRPDLEKFTEELWNCVEDCGLENNSTLFHGDLHFNNMFFDFGKNRLTVIDARGEFFGHWLYDVAKLIHSVIGKFDFIDSRLFSAGDRNFKIYSAGTEQLEKFFTEEILGDLSAEQTRLVYKTTASLFASMQPLHKDFPDKIVEYEKIFEYFNQLSR